MSHFIIIWTFPRAKFTGASRADRNGYKMELFILGVIANITEIWILLYFVI